MAKKTSFKPGKLVVTAIKNLMKNTGWTTRTIVKFIKTEYHISDSAIGRKVSRALKRGVKLGLLESERGRYRLTNMSGFAQTVRACDVRLQRTTARDRPLRIRSRSPPL